MSGLAAMKLAQTHLDLVGESFLHLRRTVDGRILGFEVIPPTSVMSTPTVDNQFFQIQTQSGLVSVPATEVLWVKHMSPIDPTGRGVGIAMSLGGELQITEHISESLKSIFARGGMGTTVVSVAAADQNQDSTDIAEDISKNFDGNVIGPHQQGKIVVLPGKISATTINNDLKQLEVVSIQKSIQDHIRQVFAIPPEILGDTSSSNRSTAEAAEYHLQAYSILPRLEFLAAELNARLVPLVDSGAILDFDDPRPSSLDVCMGLMTNGNTAHAFTQNEVRRLTGLAPTPGGDTNLLPPPGSKPVSKTPENNK
jgi:HK97 family phage portal protein